MRRELLLLAVVAGCARGATPAPAPESSRAAPPSPAAAPAITPEGLRRDLFVFASDSFMGRETGTPGAMAGTRFITERLRAAGVEPAGDSGTYLQRVPLTRSGLASSSAIRLTRDGRTRTVPIGAEGLVPLLSLGPGAPLPRLEASGEIVFAGYALSEAGRSDLSGLDVRNKVVVYVHGAPASADSATAARLSSGQAIGQRLGTLIPLGPAAIVMLTTGELADEFDAVASQLVGSMRVGAPEVEGPRPLPMVLIGVAAERSELVPAGYPQNDRPGPLAGTLEAALAVEQREIEAYNVVGIVRGSDPVLRDTYVAVGAHLDHIGIQIPVDGDSIGNGADDDGSGSMGVLHVAETWARMPVKPKRSGLFVWHTGEEKGLLGSQWFADHPPVPIDSVVAQLNADMIGRNHPDSIYIVGPEAAPQQQSVVLGAIVDSVNAALPAPFAFNREWDSPTHPERIYFRSDHYHYAAKGVPIIFFTTGLHDDYHKVSDEPDKIDYDKLARVSTLILRASEAIANRESRPAPPGGRIAP
ncbi:MAG TPA: M28 family peptidase [Gemmatimonadaceae bacterium]|nr:M28 family peptidase [Gemmatimonadaceae bacterium]